MTEQQLIQLFATAADKHSVCNWFSHGAQDFTYSSMADVKFPLLFVQSTGADPGDARITYNFTVYALATPLPEPEVDSPAFAWDTGLVEARDTALQILKDIVGRVQLPHQQDFILTTTGFVSDGNRHISDNNGSAVGWRTDISIEMDFVQDDSNFPELALLDMIIASTTDLSYGGGNITFTLSGAANTEGSYTLVPAIEGTTLSANTFTLDDDGMATVVAAIPENTDLTSGRSFQLQAMTSDQNPILSEPVSQDIPKNLLTKVDLNINSFGTGQTIYDIEVRGRVGVEYDLHLSNLNPGGWVPLENVTAESSVIPEGGIDNTVMVNVPLSDNEQARDFQILAVATNDNTQTIISPIFRQQSADEVTLGNLIANGEALHTANSLDVIANITQGDQPFTAVLNQNATDATDTPIETISVLSPAAAAFTTIDTSEITENQDYYIHISDQTNTVVIPLTAIDFTNDIPTGSISQTFGAKSPVIGDSLAFAARYEDPENQDLTYQWQMADKVISTSTARDKAELTTSQYTTKVTFGRDLGAVGTVEWAVDSAITDPTPSILAIWATDADHATELPIALYHSSSIVEGFSFGGSAYSATGTTEAQNTALLAISTETTGGLFGHSTIPDANVEIWIGDTYTSAEVVEIVGAYTDITDETARNFFTTFADTTRGFFRCNVSDGTNSVTSNQLEIT